MFMVRLSLLLVNNLQYHCFLLIIFMKFKQGSLRKSTTRESPPNKKTEANMNLLSRQSTPLPDIAPPTCPRHYTTPLGARETRGPVYNVPAIDGYEVPVNKGNTYITIVDDKDEAIYAEVEDTKA